MITRTSKTQTRLDEINRLPEQSKFLLAYWLNCNCSEFDLISSDTDAQPLVDKGWLDKLPGAVFGLQRYRFYWPTWRQLKAIKGALFLKVNRTDFERYIKRKTSCYPWCW